jgi:hypothetical protein
MSSEPPSRATRSFFQRHPILREAICWAIPALIIGAVLRILFMAYLPYAFWGADSRSFYSFAHKLFYSGSLSLGDKRRYLYPILMVPITLLPGAPLRWLAFFQHTFGLLSLLPLAYAIRKSLTFWRLWIVPITVVYAGLPIILWDEHELLGDHLFFALLLWTFGGWTAWVSQEQLARAQRMFWVFFVPFTLFILTKPSGRFVWPGILLALLMVKAWRVLDGKQYVALLLLIIVTPTVGSRKQGAWLFYNSVFPLTRLDTPLHAEYKAEIRDMIERYRRDIDIYHVLEDKEPFYFLRDPSEQDTRPLWKALGADERLKDKIYMDLAIEGVKARPDLFLYIGLERVVFDANVSAYGVSHYEDGQFTERTQVFYDEAQKDEGSPVRLAFAMPKKGPIPPYDIYQHTLEPAPGSWPARVVRAWVGAYGQKLDFLRYPPGGKEQLKVPLVKVTFLGWWFFAGILLSFTPGYWRTLGAWALISVGYVFGVYLISVDNVHYIAPAWSIFFVLLAVPAEAILRLFFRGPSKTNTATAAG